MSKGLQEYLPIRMKEPTRRINVDIPLRIVEKAEKMRKQMGLTWISLVQGFMEKYIDDLGPKAQPPKQMEGSRVSQISFDEKSHWK